nr:MAG TPA: hypothetical protein [Caudoviricetes sp.]
MKYYIIKILNEQISNECSGNALTRTNVWSIIIFVNNKKDRAKRFKRCANSFLLDSIKPNTYNSIKPLQKRNIA